MQTGAQVASQAVDGLLARIDQLAAKLGTTATNVWNIYIAQSRVEAIRDFSIFAIFTLLAIASGFLANMCIRKSARTRNEDLFGAGVAAIVFGVIFLIIGLFWLYPAIGEWFNPQYWAFQHITADIKGLL